MKFSAQEEYGLRCLLHIARSAPGASLTIAEIAVAEGISVPYVAKLMRLLRKRGFVSSSRGQSGGYSLEQPPRDIGVADVLASLGGRLFDQSFCDRHSGTRPICTHTVDCSIRSVWGAVQKAVDSVLDDLTLEDLVSVSRPALVEIQTAR